MHTPDGSGKQEVSTHLFYSLVVRAPGPLKGPAPGWVSAMQLSLHASTNTIRYFDAEFGFE